MRAAQYIVSVSTSQCGNTQGLLGLYDWIDIDMKEGERERGRHAVNG